ncbi:CHASE2 domain-containing protein (plasmid) [Acaryochloris sp. 'Moss Beach']|uniref:CHASE2 domain-containing protein n=1 Tax=Acaryochloris sp. 'Moss Beach' TaxID=2740837 RepID=UPI001F41780B|nr:CHASE2 domain-containing protein [Acaryochloris sp. 'Moss Beach']UJB73018.1 CHASE2 domain-containing protein [Acaryochloris sp. 'Moss Beach']
MKTPTQFELKVRRIGDLCEFTLTGQGGTSLVAEVPFPVDLSPAYDRWKTAYLAYYGQGRGEVVTGGSLNPPGTRAQLVLAEDHLRSLFQDWLRHAQLHDLQAEIAQAVHGLDSDGPPWVDVFLTCLSRDLARLPWETWEMGMDPGAAAQIRIARRPVNIRQTPVKPLRRAARVLVIVGQGSGLNLDLDKAVLTADLPTTVKVTVYQPPPETDPTAYLQGFHQQLQDPRGWDMLFFCGHSDETPAGGQLELAPQVSIQMSELKEVLGVARQRGLQFALFNSCNGLDIAETLIEAGIGQVVVMREPIPDAAAPVFLKAFLQHLAKHRDVHEALQLTCSSLKRESLRLIYPAVALVPSLFRHPQSRIFRIQPYGIRHQLRRWQPSPREQRWLALLLCVSLVRPLQDLLLEPRIAAQAVYQQLTGQVAPPQDPPPVLFVEINNDSFKDKGGQLIDHRYVNYGYLARLVTQLSQQNAQVIGIDYLLDRPQKQPEEAKQLKEAIEQARDAGTEFVFAARQRNGRREGIQLPQMAAVENHEDGDIDLYEWIVELPRKQDCRDQCPFAYQLAHKQAASSTGSKPRTLHLWSQNSRLFFQQWFEPIIDFSIPEPQVYERVSACGVLGTCSTDYSPAPLNNQVVLIGHGGYLEEGVSNAEDDNYAQPLARQFLALQAKANLPEQFTGGEAHAYSIHHLLRQHLVIPIPDFLMILCIALWGKGIRLYVLENPQHKTRCYQLGWLAIVLYIWISLQLYISALILMPMGLPLCTYLTYIWPGKKEIKDA